MGRRFGFLTILGIVLVGVLSICLVAHAAERREGSVTLAVCDYGHDAAVADCEDGTALAGTVVVTALGPSPLRVYRYTLVWTSTAGGAVSANPFTIPHSNLLQVKIVPNGGGTAPTTLYDITLVDDDLLDYLSGRGTDMSATLPLMLQWDPPVMWFTPQSLDLVVANAGASKGGTVRLWVRAQ